MLSNNLFKIDNNDQKDEFHYFRNIRTFLQSHDFSVHHTNVDWDGLSSDALGNSKTR